MAKHDHELERAAHNAALESVRAIWDGPLATINGNAQLKSLSRTELDWIVSMAISEWIVARSRQVTEARVGVEALIRTMQGEPEPWDAGAIEACLPILGDLVVQMETTDMPIGSWPKHKVMQFAWACFVGLDAARTNREERDEIPFDQPEPSTLMAG